MPVQVRQLDEHPHTPPIELLTVPDGHIFTHLELVTDYLR